MSTRLLLAALSWGFALLALAPRPASAQSDTTGARRAMPDTVALPVVTVEADRLPAGGVGHAVTSLDRADVEATGARDAADLLAMRSPLFVRRYGAGGLATVSLRGAGSAQTLVLVDGQRVADPQTGQVDLSLLPAVLLEDADVVSGAQSGRHGSGALGGVVRLRTLRPTRDLRVRTTAEAGAFGERRLGVAASGGHGPVAILAAAEHSTTDGDFPYRTTGFAPHTARRRGADRAQTTLFGKVHYDGSPGTWEAMGWYTGTVRGLPGATSGAPSGARQWDEALRLQARHERPTSTGALTVAARGQHTTRRYLNPSDHPAYHADQTTRTLSAALDAGLRSRLGLHWHGSGGIVAGVDRADLRGGVTRWQATTHLGGTGRYGPLALAPAVRLDAFASAQGRDVLALAPQLGARLDLPGAWHARASAGRAFRVPTLGERFYEPTGNPDLRVEKGWSGEAGLAYARRRARYGLHAEATAFAYRLRDQIVWYPSTVAPGLQVWRPTNVARTATRGVELAAGARLRPARTADLAADLAFTHTDARDRSNPDARSFDQPLRHVPRQQLKLHLSARWGPLLADLTARLVGRRFVTTDASRAMPAYQVVDAHLRLRETVGPVQATLGLALDNALDASYAVMSAYPMPPRHARLHLTLETLP